MSDGEAGVRTLAITQNITVDGSIEMLGDWFDPQGQVRRGQCGPARRAPPAGERNGRARPGKADLRGVLRLLSDQVNDAFKEGLQEGFDRTTGAIKATIAAPFKFTFASLPWQVYLVGLVLLFFYMGGPLWLKGILKRR